MIPSVHTVRASSARPQQSVEQQSAQQMLGYVAVKWLLRLAPWPKELKHHDMCDNLPGGQRRCGAWHIAAQGCIKSSGLALRG